MSERDYFIEFSKQLGEMTSAIRGVLARLEKGDERMTQHEARICALEHQNRQAEPAQHQPEKMELKEWIIRQLVKLLTWGTLIVGSLVGADSILTKALH